MLQITLLAYLPEDPQSSFAMHRRSRLAWLPGIVPGSRANRKEPNCFLFVDYPGIIGWEVALSRNPIAELTLTYN